jgi:hypothetical protein
MKIHKNQHGKNQLDKKLYDKMKDMVMMNMVIDYMEKDLRLDQLQLLKIGVFYHLMKMIMMP